MPPWFFASLRGYRIEWLPQDLIAGIMLAAIAIPGQLATARLAGMPPETGLYAFAAGSLAFAAFGANRFMSVAADSTIAPILAGGLAAMAVMGTAHYAELVTLLALMVGLILVAVGLLRAGWLATLLSIPVTTGFLAGISIHIIVGELPTLLGISQEQHEHLLLRLFHTLGRLGEANPYSLALGAAVLDRPDNVSRDFSGVGIGNILAGLIGSFCVDSSPPSTAIVAESGGRSQIASLTAVALMFGLAVLAAGSMAYVPHAALSGILVYIALKIFRVDEMIRIYRRGGREILLVAASGGLVVALPIATGMLLAIVLSFVYSLYVVARPYCAELARVPGTTVWWPPGRSENSERVPGVLVFAPAAPLTFTNAQYISDQIMIAIAKAPVPVKLLVIEASGMIDVDYTGSQVLQQTIARLRSRSIEVAIARLSDTRAQLEANRTGLIAAIGPEHVFKSVEEAVRRIGPHA